MAATCATCSSPSGRESCSLWWRIGLASPDAPRRAGGARRLRRGTAFSGRLPGSRQRRYFSLTSSSTLRPTSSADLASTTARSQLNATFSGSDSHTLHECQHHLGYSSGPSRRFPEPLGSTQPDTRAVACVPGWPHPLPAPEQARRRSCTRRGTRAALSFAAASAVLFTGNAAAKLGR
jgi:hypothetical protein